MTTGTFDVLVIGGGPGGYVAALRASQLKLRTALVESDRLGGVCLNWGCIPTKSLLHTADTLRAIRHAGELGIRVGAPEIDFPLVMARSRKVSERLNRGVTHLLRKAGVEVLEGRAAFAADRSVEVRGAAGQLRRIRAANTILATGAHPRGLPALPFDGGRVWSYRDALSATELPRSLLVIGAGAIGMEFASFYATLGTKVTLVEAQPRVLPAGDHEVSEFVRKAFEREGLAVRTGASIESAAVAGEEVRVALKVGGAAESVTVERVLVAIGLDGNVDGLGLEHTRVRVDGGRVAADGWGATDEPGVHAIGDLVGAPMLAHKASHQGVACVERIAGLHAGESAPRTAIPACVYSHPQSASIGLGEEDARARGVEFRVGRFPLEGNGKAIAIGATTGFVKTIFDARSGELLGAHIVGAEAPELIQGFAVAMTLESTEADLIETVFPHPTLSEAMHESVLAAFGRPLHV